MLITKDAVALPCFLEELFINLELHGMHAVGVYRKAGAAATVRQLEKDLNTGEILSSHVKNDFSTK